ncbi:MAG: bifunctional helix-turn-helix domain-containing protein/methylated-DNA--[protein]-cysteine S-methyltransferase [Rhodobacteraceae bacterium]|nr:bifunctional helix-turn-helix domain-containing protein/methylated-DNA--[protein]-cysteine S-methyltransferase [Paracoccaceae bacterium]MCY4197683.1 bifunctional helix-turn-helix domain-containing protein/methylated-DNA--[protein]-cysteine S-methyltransferase [Paracoccaceae bacterium]MCY4327995.1 bifunctional helix-turn-helix domain-containing protein/methylated-DNA--[protein]-cysteine S-methyltransferase [Paracoccaceae bacterium]
MNPKNDRIYHYNVIARSLKIIDTAGRDMSLAELAQQLDMSPAHFQRVFSRWAGVSPQRYQQYLKLNRAKELLRNQANLLETANALGLSGSGRLHDLLLRWEAMSPGEYARGGAGLRINWGWFDSPFGDMLAMGTARGLCGLAFGNEVGHDRTFNGLAQQWPRAQLVKDPEFVRDWVNSALAQQGTIQLHVMGGPFHIKVWEALLDIPGGRVSTYSDLAQHAGVPKACRAVGTAIGRNPISWLIPCHRILRKSGELGGYRWGLTVKRAMLEWESVRHDPSLVNSDHQTM